MNADQAVEMGIVLPSQATLDKYGIDLKEWLGYIPKGVCPITGIMPGSGRFVVDHDHVRNWAKLPPEKRRLYVRGVTSVVANHYCLTRYMTADRARRIAVYLDKYAKRRPA